MTLIAWRWDSAHDLKAELDNDGCVGKCRVSKTGRATGGKAFSTGAPYLLLKNRRYHGEAEHKGAVYLGQHEAVIDEGVWEQVLALVAGSRVDRATGVRSSAPGLLAGLLFDEKGEWLSPTHADKRGTRYRYYVGAPLVRGNSRGRDGGCRPVIWSRWPWIG